VRPLTIDRALADKRLIGAALGDLDTWSTWACALKAAFALPLDEDEREMFMTISGNRPLPTKRVRELWCLVGRRGGKSRIAAALAVYFALFVPAKLAPGETGFVLVLAASVDQARVVFDYIEAFIAASPVLCKEVDSVTKSEIRLNSGVIIGVHANSFRSIRGRSLLCCVFDECAFWRDEASATPDGEVYSAVLPSLSSTGGMLIGISTPYRKMGLLHQKYRDNFGVDTGDDILVIQGATERFNPMLSAAEIASQKRADPTAADAEWNAQFRGDVSAFLPDDLIEQAIDYARPIELPPMTNTSYRAFCDASGGTGADCYTLAIAHRDGEHYVLDLCYGTSPGQSFDPDRVTQEYAAVCKRFGVGTILGDHYSANWVASSWARTGITYAQSTVHKSQIYIECMPLFSAGLVRIPDHQTLVRELRLLERRTHRSGRDTVDHRRSGHDDFANAMAGAFHALAAQIGYLDDAALLRALDGDDGAPPQPRYPATSGPNAPGAIPLGNGGYKAPRWWG
jgi:hypothetical protein